MYEGDLDHASEVLRRLLEAREDAVGFLEPTDQGLDDVASLAGDRRAKEAHLRFSCGCPTTYRGHRISLTTSSSPSHGQTKATEVTRR